MMTDKTIQNLKPAIGEHGRPKARKVADRDGLYVLVTAAGTKLFRFDYRIHGRRETLALGKYDATRAKELLRELGKLEYGMYLSLAEARLLLTRARRSVESGE